tara:strand:- start:4864 stop:6813 length:1950 start_codon:yes stop_codon:yes gene_type:complete
MKQKILVKGPVLSQSGYGEQARFALRALRSRTDIFDVYVLPTPWGRTGWVSLDNEERGWIDERIAAAHHHNQHGGKYDISLQITIPNEWEKLAPINVGYTAGIETTRVAPVWLQKANEMDKIIVVSNHSKEVFKTTTYTADHPQTGQLVNLLCHTDIDVVNYPVKEHGVEKLDLKLTHDFNYLAISQWGPRKNFDNLINWFIEENFDQEVGLVLKTSISNNSIIDREHTENRLRNIVSRHGDMKCKVYLVHGDMSEAQMAGLYTHPKIKCLISTAHGEGYGLPLFEAAYNGLPVVVHSWSGQSDFLYVPQKNGKRKPMFASVEYDLQPVQPEAVWEGVIQAESEWAFPREASFKRRLREVRNEYSRFKRNATRLKKYLVEHFSNDKINTQFCNSILGNSSSIPQELGKISFCIPTNGARVEKTQTTIKSIERTMGSHPYEIVIAGNVEPFSNLKNVILVDKKEESLTRRVAALRNAAADKSTGDTIAWCDDDIVVDSAWLDNITTYSSNNGWSVLGCKLLNPDGTRHWDRGTINPRALVSYDYPSYSKNILQTSGFFLVRREVFNRVRWNEDRLVYADRQEKQIPEDLQYSFDLMSSGYQLQFDQHSTVWHNDESYTEWGNSTLLKEVIEQQTGMGFFPPPCDEFVGLL